MLLLDPSSSLPDPLAHILHLRHTKAFIVIEVSLYLVVTLFIYSAPSPQKLPFLLICLVTSHSYPRHSFHHLSSLSLSPLCHLYIACYYYEALAL